MMRQFNSELVDNIYAAAFIPDIWQKVLCSITKIANSKESILMVAKSDDIKLLSGTTEYNEILADYFGKFPGGGDRTRRLVAHNYAGFVTDRDVYTEKEISEAPIFQEFLIPKGLGQGIATVIHAPHGESIIFHSEADIKLGQFNRNSVDQLDALRPHLARATMLASRMGFEQAKAATQAMELMGIAAAMLDKSGSILSANSLFHAFVPSIFQDRKPRVCLTDVALDMILANAIQHVAQPDGNKQVFTLPWKGTEKVRPMLIHLAPVRGDARQIFTSASSLLIVTCLDSRSATSATLIQCLFDLTPAEARIAHAVASGLTVRQIAKTSKLSELTIRNQLNRVLEKTGTGRQVELVSLLRCAVSFNIAS